MDASAPPPIAVIDLGTNTFHLLICRLTPKGYLEELYRERRFIKLAEAGIGSIGNAAYLRGQGALLQFRSKMDEYGVEAYRALGTAALRSASNGPLFIEEALEKARINIQLISGDEEARLIARGVSLALGKAGRASSETYLIMDIGGGSVEFILCQGEKTIFAQSFPVGLAVLYRNFHRSEPISKQETAELEQFLKKQLRPLNEVLKSHLPVTLIGAAGIFDVLIEQLAISQPGPQTYLLDHKQFQQLHDRLISTDLPSRMALPEVPNERADMIVVSMLLIQYIIQMGQVEKILVSTYAMKEGALAEMTKG